MIRSAFPERKLLPTPYGYRLTLIAILLLAAALRFPELERVPPPFNVDEACNAYDAYAILRTGRDQWGRPWPITFRAFNDYRRPATIYAAVPFVALFGLTIFAIRAAAALWGWLCVLFVHRLARDMFGRSAGLSAALMLALSPWHITFSRVGLEASGPMLTVLTLALWSLWRWHRTHRRRWLTASAASFALTFYTYTTMQAFIPLLLGVMAVIFRRELWAHRADVLRATLLLGLLVLPLVVALTTTPATWNRLHAVTVLRPDVPLAEGMRRIVRQWLGHFSPVYLFLRGDAQPVHHDQGFGMLYWADALFLLLGIRALFRWKRDRKAVAILVAWLILGPVPAALTVEDMGTPHAMRGLAILPAWSLLSGLGLASLGEVRHVRLRAVLIGALLGALAWNARLVLHHYFTVYPVEAARAFEYGLREAMAYVAEHEAEYETIVLTDWISQPHIFAVFFLRYDPRLFQSHHAPYGDHLSEKLTRWGDKYMSGDVEALYGTLDRALFVVRPHMLKEVPPLFVVRHPDGSVAFKVIASPLHRSDSNNNDLP